MFPCRAPRAPTRARAWLGFSGAGAGDPADIVLYDADPRADLEVLTRPRTIVYDGALVDLIPLITQDPVKQRKLLVDNPARLYRF